MKYRMIGIDVGVKERLSRDSGAELFIDLKNFTRDKEGVVGIAKAAQDATGAWRKNTA
jgi:hypothetical protein